MRHSVGKVTPWGRSLRGEGHSVGKSCPALSSEPGLILLTAQVVRGSVGSPNVMVGDRLELDACDLELVCTLYLRLSKFQLSAAPARRPPDRTEKKLRVRCSGALQAAVRAKGSEIRLRPGDRSHVSQKKSCLKEVVARMVTETSSTESALGSRKQAAIPRDSAQSRPALGPIT